MSSRPLMIVSLSVRPDREAEFNSFYHHEFLPTTLEAVPEFTAVTRYQETSLSLFEGGERRSVTVYEIASEDVLEKAMIGFSRPQLQPLVQQFQSWKSDFGTFTRVLFSVEAEHGRRDIPMFRGNGLYLQTWETKPEMHEGFWNWYHNQYLTRLMADVPGWSGCTTCASVGTEPTRYMVFLEACDKTVLQDNLRLMHSPHRAKENIAWGGWSQRALDFTLHGTYERIFRLPD